MIPFNYVQKKENGQNGEKGGRGKFESSAPPLNPTKGKEMMEKRGAVKLHTMPLVLL